MCQLKYIQKWIHVIGLEKKGAAKEDFATISATVFPMVYQTSKQFPMKEISFKIINQKRAIVIILKLVRKPNPKRPHVVT